MQYGATSNAAGFVPAPYHDDWAGKVCADGMFECPNAQCGNRYVRRTDTLWIPGRFQLARATAAEGDQC